MPVVDVVWVRAGDTPSKGLCWDQAMLIEALDRKLWRVPGGVDFVHRDDWSELPPDADGAVVIIPGRYHAEPGQVEALRRKMRDLAWWLAIVVSDEESLFDWRGLGVDEDERRALWVMTPRPNLHAFSDHVGRIDTQPAVGIERFLGEYWPSGTREELAGAMSADDDKPLDWFFAGQITHSRRVEMAQVLRKQRGGYFVETEGFTQGLPRGEYLSWLSSAKLAPAPSGPATMDSFRLFEALEAGCIPLADAHTPKRDTPGYWRLLFGGDPPFPIVDDWVELASLIPKLLQGWPANANRVYAWWQGYKRQLAVDLDDTVQDLARLDASRLDVDDRVTVIIPTSPIPAHPDTSMIEATIASVRHWLPTAEIIVCIDGVRREQQRTRGDAYHEYVRRLLWLTNFELGNVVPLLFDEHQHQANMTRAALELVDTDTVLFVEHDTPLVVDEPIDWFGIVNVVEAEAMHLIRLHHEAGVLEAHQHLMIDVETPDGYDVPLLRTQQWSQRPHVASTRYYRRILREHFPETCRTMIEDKMHSVAQVEGWLKHRLAIYAPGANLKRSLNLDGRGDDPKYPMRLQ